MNEEQILTRQDLLSPHFDNHAAAWDRLRDLCMDYGLNPPTLLEIIQANAKGPEGNMINGYGKGWFDHLGIGELKNVLLAVNESIVALPGGSVVNIAGGCFIKLSASAD